jgi:hypothetical protein
MKLQVLSRVLENNQRPGGLCDSVLFKEELEPAVLWEIK